MKHTQAIEESHNGWNNCVERNIRVVTLSLNKVDVISVLEEWSDQTTSRVKNIAEELKW